MKDYRIRAVVLLVLMMAAAAMAQDVKLYDDRPKISVSGQAVVRVVPDKIVISFGIETFGRDIEQAKQKNIEIVKNAVAECAYLDVPETSIQTDQLSIEPKWRDNHRWGDFMGYCVRNTIVVTLTDVSKIEKLVSRALRVGVNYIHGVEFQTTEYKTHRQKARELALKAAKEKAVKMAAVLGETVGRPVTIQENQYGTPWNYWSGWGGWDSGRSHGMSQVVAQVDSIDAGDDGGAVMLGKLTIQASVNVTFELVHE